jgi:hypothetical protein
LNLSQIDGDLTVGDVTYTQEELQDLFRDVATWKKSGGLKPGDPGFDDAKASLTEADLTLNRADWLGAKSKVWKNILVYPAFFIFIIAAIFLMLGKNPPAEQGPAEEEAPDEQPQDEAADEGGSPDSQDAG